jgi:hypothetical protein
MYGLTRGAVTLIGVVLAGFLIWLGVEPLGGEETSRGEYWWSLLMCALAGFAIALSQLLGGWTKWGWPRISLNVFLLAFVPALIAGGWVLLYGQPGDGNLAGDVRDWTNDLGIEGLVGDLAIGSLAIAFAIGLVFGLTFDTTGPVARRRDDVAPAHTARAGAAPADTTADRDDRTVDGDDRRVRLRDRIRGRERARSD